MTERSREFIVPLGSRWPAGPSSGRSRGFSQDTSRSKRKVAHQPIGRPLCCDTPQSTRECSLPLANDGLAPSNAGNRTRALIKHGRRNPATKTTLPLSSVPGAVCAVCASTRTHCPVLRLQSSWHQKAQPYLVEPEGRAERHEPWIYKKRIRTAGSKHRNKRKDGTLMLRLAILTSLDLPVLTGICCAVMT